MIKPKSKGVGIMVYDFIDEFDGFLALTKAQYNAAKVSNPGIKKYACEFLEYGEVREGYWTRDRLVAQIAETKYPKASGW